MKIRKLPNRCCLPVFLMMFGVISLNMPGQAAAQNPLPANRVPIKLDNRTFGNQRTTTPRAVNQNSQPVPIIGMGSFGKYSKASSRQGEPKSSGRLDFSSQVPVVPVDANQEMSSRNIPKFTKGIDLEVVPLKKPGTFKKPEVGKTRSLPPIVSVDSVEKGKVKQVIYASRGDARQGDDSGLPPITPHEFEAPSKPLPKIIHSGRTHKLEVTNVKSVPLFDSKSVQQGPVYITRQPEPFEKGKPQPAIISEPVQELQPQTEPIEVPVVPVTKPKELVNDYFKAIQKKATQPKALPPIVSADQVIPNIPVVPVSPSRKEVPVVSEVPLYQAGKKQQAETSAPPIVSGLPQSTVPVVPQKGNLAETMIPKSFVPKSIDPKSIAPQVIVPKTIVPKATAPEAVAPEIAVSEPVVPKTVVPKSVVPKSVVPKSVVPKSVVPKMVIPKTVAIKPFPTKPFPTSAPEVGSLTVPVKAMEQPLATKKSLIKPTSASQATVAASSAPKVARVAKQQNVMPESSIAPTLATQEAVGFGGGVPGGQTMFPRSPFAVVRGEAIYMTRENGSATFSNSFNMDPFDYQLGVRLHMQRLLGVEGASLTYTGIQEWNGVARRAGGPFGVAFDTTGAPLAMAPFIGANFQQQYHNGSMHSLEYNRVTWGWDVLNLFWGFRFTHYEEEFDFFSRRADGQQGLFNTDLENYIFGPQVGGEVFYDVGGIFSTGVKVKLGAMANALDRDTLVIANGVRRINNSDSDVKFNFMAELGLFGRMRLGPNAHLRAGYEMWYNSDVYSVRDNIPGAITSAIGTTSISDDLFIHGATAGIEILW